MLKFNSHQLGQIRSSLRDQAIVQKCSIQWVRIRLIRPDLIEDEEDETDVELDCSHDENEQEPEVFEDYDCVPWSNEPYKFIVNGTGKEGITDKDGVLYEEIPLKATSAIIEIGVGQQLRRIPVKIGEMEPSDVPEGLQKRLSNLAFAPGAIDGYLGPQTTRALNRFRKTLRLPTDESLDETTVSNLERSHRS